jgi:hypothetical protein
MNPHIELVKKWLADPDSVTVEELRENSRAAYLTIDFTGDSYEVDCAANHAACKATEAARNNASYTKTTGEMPGNYWTNKCAYAVDRFDSIVAKK